MGTPKLGVAKLLVEEVLTNMKEGLVNFCKKQKVPLEAVIKVLLFKILSQSQNTDCKLFRKSRKSEKRFV